jgi:DnaJ-class molecular chaperone
MDLIAQKERGIVMSMYSTLDGMTENWCSMCDGSGEGYAPDTICVHCKGRGVRLDDEYEPEYEKED